MANEKKHQFGGLDLRSNVLSRVDGSARDTSNVILDESRNLVKRSDYSRLDVPRAEDLVNYDPDTQLHPTEEIVGIFEFNDSLVLLTYTLSPAELAEEYNKLYVYDSDSNTLQSKVFVTPNTADYNGTGDINGWAFAIRGNLSSIVKNGKLYIVGDLGCAVDVGYYFETETRPPRIIQFDGENVWGAGVYPGQVDGYITDEMPDLSPSDPYWYVKYIRFHIDSAGYMEMADSPTYKIEAYNSGSGPRRMHIPSTVNMHPPGSTNSPDELAAITFNNLVTFQVADAHLLPDRNITTPLSIHGYAENMPPVPGCYIFLPLGLKGYVYDPNLDALVWSTLDTSPDFIRGRVSKSIAAPSGPNELEFDLFEAWVDGKWVDVYSLQSGGANIGWDSNLYKNPSGEILISSVHQATYISKSSTAGFQYYIRSSVTSLQAYSPEDSAVDPNNPSYIPPGYVSIEPNEAIESWRDKQTPPFPLSKFYEDALQEGEIYTNFPPVKQIVRYGENLVAHDGKNLYFSSSSVNASFSQMSPFNTFSVGSEEDGPITAIFANSDFVTVHRKFSSYLIIGNILTGNFQAKPLKDTGIGCSSSGSMVGLNGGNVFCSYKGIYTVLSNGSLQELSDLISPIFTLDHYNFNPDLSRVKTTLDKFKESIYFYIPSKDPNTDGIILWFSYYFNQWFKLDGINMKGGSLIVQNSDHALFMKHIFSDGKDLYLVSSGNQVEGYYKSNFLTAGEPSLRKTWDKLVLFLVGSPDTEIIFDSLEDWDHSFSGTSTKDTIEVKKSYIVDMKSFAPSDSYSRSVELTSEKGKDLLVNGYEVTFDMAQDDQVDDNEEY